MPPLRNRSISGTPNSQDLGGCDQRPYRSKKQKPCTECRKRRVGCIRQGSSACKLCNERSLRCIVEARTSNGKGDEITSKVATSRSRVNKDHAPSSTPLEADERPQLETHNTHTAQHVGPTSDHDTFILRHDCWVSSNSPAMSSIWARRTTTRDRGSPVLFTVSTVLN